MPRCPPCIRRWSSWCPPAMPMLSVQVLACGLRRGRFLGLAWWFWGWGPTLASETSLPVEQVQASSCSPRSSLCCFSVCCVLSTRFRLGEVTEPRMTSLSPIPCGWASGISAGPMLRVLALGLFPPYLDTLCPCGSCLNWRCGPLPMHQAQWSPERPLPPPVWKYILIFTFINITKMGSLKANTSKLPYIFFLLLLVLSYTFPRE